MKLSHAKYRAEADIRNIIFDWGGVITDLHVDDTIRALRELGNDKFDMLLKNGPNEIFKPFETGSITPDEFHVRIRKYLDPELSERQIDDAWSSMLGALPEERWRVLEDVRNNYRTFLLSNTNYVHIHNYAKFIQRTYGTYGFFHLFEKVFLSYELGMRKPDEDIFLYVLEKEGLKPEETFFIDDTEENILTASKLGMHAYLLEGNETLPDLFDIR